MKIAVLAGDGIGPEVTAEALRILKAVCPSIETQEALIGGTAIKKTGEPLPAATLDLAKASNAVLLGAVGLPEFDTAPPNKRPEAGLLGLRKALGLYANLRPARIFPGLEHLSPLRADIVKGTDILTVRELASGIYYGTPRGRDGDRTVNTMSYTRAEVERVAIQAFRFAQGRRKKVTSVDKANVLECSTLWRATVTEVAKQFPDVQLEHQLVDSCAMQLVTNPRRFDVLLTENMFGDILSDEASVLAGSIGMLPSASLGEGTALYEPVHGSAPDVAGQGVANPAGAIGSVAMMLRHTLNMNAEADAVDRALEQAITGGIRTRDLGGTATTRELGDAVLTALTR